MAFRCGFFNSVAGDRKYNADEMNNPYKAIISDGVIAKTDDSDAFQVQADVGLNLIIKKGSGIFAGKWAILDADMSLTIPTPHVTMTRIDSVIVRIDNSESVRNGSIEYIQGEASTSPVAPELTRTSTVTEYRLANITVEANIKIFSQSKIEDTRPTSECGFVTNLLRGSDITATYRQWESQFQEWLNQSKTEWNQEQQEYETWTSNKKGEFDTWYDNIKDTLSKTNLMTSYFSHYTTTEDNETEIPINITALNSVLDCVQVHINGILLIPEVDYTMNEFETITLTKPVDVNTTISFLVLKTIDGSEAETVVKQVQDIFNILDELNAFNVSELEQDVTELKSKTETFESKTETLESKTETLEQDVTELKSKTETFETRLGYQREMKTYIDCGYNDSFPEVYCEGRIINGIFYGYIWVYSSFDIESMKLCEVPYPLFYQRICIPNEDSSLTAIIDVSDGKGHILGKNIKANTGYCCTFSYPVNDEYYATT